MKKQYEPIPVPFKQRFNRFRVRILPLIIFIITILAVISLWKERISTPGFIGEVVADYSTVSSPGDGTIIHFLHEPFDSVEKGEILGYVAPKDSVLLNVQLNLIQSEMNYIRESMDPLMNLQRNRMNFESLKIEEIETRIDLAQAEINHQKVTAEYERAVELLERDLISTREYEMIKAELDVLTNSITSYRELAAYLQSQIRSLEEDGAYLQQERRDPVLAAIRVQEQRMENLLAESAPRPLYAPISGVISTVHHKENEYVRSGVPILQIESAVPSYVVGYVRQPFTVVPQEGMPVQIRSRKSDRSIYTSTIEQLGGHIQIIAENLQRPGIAYESGLPVRIPIVNAEEVDLTPGEIVDIVLRPN